MNPAQYSTPPRRREYGHTLFTRHVTYGIKYGRPPLMVPCVTCHAEIGKPCRISYIRPTHTIVDSAALHLERWSTAFKFCEIMNSRHAEKLERENPGSYWSWEVIPHQCGTLGPHTREHCTDWSKWVA